LAETSFGESGGLRAQKTNNEQAIVIPINNGMEVDLVWRLMRKPNSAEATGARGETSKGFCSSRRAACCLKASLERQFAMRQTEIAAVRNQQECRRRMRL
jgi:hypothetical protein